MGWGGCTGLLHCSAEFHLGNLAAFTQLCSCLGGGGCFMRLLPNTSPGSFSPKSDGLTCRILPGSQEPNSGFRDTCKGEGGACLGDSALLSLQTPLHPPAGPCLGLGSHPTAPGAQSLWDCNPLDGHLRRSSLGHVLGRGGGLLANSWGLHCPIWPLPRQMAPGPASPTPKGAR